MKRILWSDDKNNVGIYVILQSLLSWKLFRTFGAKIIKQVQCKIGKYIYLFCTLQRFSDRKLIFMRIVELHKTCCINNSCCNA